MAGYLIILRVPCVFQRSFRCTNAVIYRAPMLYFWMIHISQSKRKGGLLSRLRDYMRRHCCWRKHRTLNKKNTLVRKLVDAFSGFSILIISGAITTRCLRKASSFVRKPKQADYGMVAVFKDLYGNLWDLLEFNADHPIINRTR